MQKRELKEKIFTHLIVKNKNGRAINPNLMINIF